MKGCLPKDCRQLTCFLAREKRVLEGGRDLAVLVVGDSEGWVQLGEGQSLAVRKGGLVLMVPQGVLDREEGVAHPALKEWLARHLLHGLKPYMNSLWRAFCSILKQQTYFCNEIIIKEGQPCPYLFVVVEGEVLLQRQVSSAKGVTVQSLVEGCAFGQESIVGGAGPKAVFTARCSSIVRVLKIPQSQLLPIFKEYSYLAHIWSEFMDSQTHAFQERLARWQRLSELE